ncbi:MAG: carbonic anhydrase [Monoraphidium minutum]|nr:MAG: carbonic anhydrase [Monoraphidium minutum]
MACNGNGCCQHDGAPGNVHETLESVFKANSRARSATAMHVHTFLHSGPAAGTIGDGNARGSGGNARGRYLTQHLPPTSRARRPPRAARTRDWADAMTASDPKFFERLTHQQAPEFLWIGCSDSRVPANQILGMAPGEIFVQRNVGNQAMHTDMNVMSCLEFAVRSLKVKTVIVCGHYNCGAVRAALELPSRTPGLVNCWISDIREARNQASAELGQLGSEAAVARLCELNVLRQAFHVCTSPVVQAAWAEGQELHVWGCIYDVADGVMRRLAGPINGDADIETLRFDGVPSPTRESAKAGGAKAGSARGEGAKEGTKAKKQVREEEAGSAKPAIPAAAR